MRVTAKLSNAPISAQKTRLVADMIRMKNVSNALNILKYTEKKAAEKILKLFRGDLLKLENLEPMVVQ